MVTKEQAAEFAEKWLAAWNSHDLDKVMAHYAEEVEYFSVFSTKLTGNGSGVIHGKEKLKEYFGRGLQIYPNLHFTLKNVFTGVKSIALLYRSINNLLAAEVFELNGEGRITRVQCHYTETWETAGKTGTT